MSDGVPSALWRVAPAAPQSVLRMPYHLDFSFETASGDTHEPG